MYKQAFIALAGALGLSLAFSSASCGPTCPAGQQSCGTVYPNAGSSAQGGAGSSGNGGNGTGGSGGCALLTAFKSCMKAYCASATNPFCTCYKRGFDLSTATCLCIDFDPEPFCGDGNGNDASNYDCAADSSRVSSICVPVN